MRFAPTTAAPQESRGRVGLFFPFSGFDSVPCLVAAVEMLCESRYSVDVFVPAGSEAASSALPYFVDSITRFPSFVERGVARPRLARVVPYDLFELGAGPVVRGHRRRAVARRLAAELGTDVPYTCLVGVDPEGLIEARLWSHLLGTPYMYWSLEILIREELNAPHRTRLKRREIAANRGALLTIVQDADRAALLAAENDIPNDRMVFVPNAGRGFARRKKSYFAHESLGIAASEFIVMATGSLAPWAMSEKLVRSAADWPEGFALVVHTRYDMDTYKDAQRVRAAADPRKVHFSARPLSPAQYESLVDSADVGLALYEPQPSASDGNIQGNLQTLGLSSGKLAAFLKAGVPVIVSRLTGPEQLVERHCCGVVIDHAGQLPDALRVVRDRCDEFSANAIRAFDDCLTMERRFQPVLAVVDGLARRDP